MLSLVNRIINSVVCVFCAPPKEYRSLGESLLQTALISIGQHHNLAKKMSVKGYLDFVLHVTPPLFKKQIVPLEKEDGLIPDCLIEKHLGVFFKYKDIVVERSDGKEYLVTQQDYSKIMRAG